MIHLIYHHQDKKDNKIHPTIEKRKSKKFTANLLLQILLVLDLLVMMEAVVVMVVDHSALEVGEVLHQDMHDNSTLSLNHQIWQINTTWHNLWQFLLILLSHCRLPPTT